MLTVSLPGGYTDEKGEVHLEAELVPLSGREEELLAQDSGPGSASLVTAVLSRCVRRLGSIAPVTDEVARGLLTADRQYLLLKLRELTFGHHVQSTVSCPWPDCQKPVDIDFSTRDIPVQPSGNKGPAYPVELSEEAAIMGDDGKPYRDIIFRLPTGADQELIVPLLHENDASALTMLLERCILQIGPWKNPSKEMLQRLSPLARMEIEKQMTQAAPRVELDLGVNCPECGREFTVPLDLQDFFFGQLQTTLDLLYREVHYLAYHYHWGEQEIMEMPMEKRRKYIEILADEIERMNDAVQ